MQSVVFRRAVRAASVAIVILWAVGASRTARGQVDGIEDPPRRVQVPAPVPDDSFRKPQFIRGDTNRDGIVDIADPVFELFHLFVGTVQMGCLATGDTNADRLIDVSDAVYGLEFLFLGKAPPPAPGPHECGVDPTDRWLPCEEYDLCGDDLLLITHVLNRVTFGPTLDLLSRIQTRDDLVRYIEQQLDPPTDYDPAIHEPELAARIDALDIGFRSYDSANAQNNRLEAMLIENGVHSQWQLLHVLTQFWNNHFHTQIGTLPQSFFGRGARGGGDGRTIATREMFTRIDHIGDGSLTEQEWNDFRALHPAVMPYSFFGRANQDGVNLDEFLQRRVVAYCRTVSAS